MGFALLVEKVGKPTNSCADTTLLSIITDFHFLPTVNRLTVNLSDPLRPPIIKTYIHSIIPFKVLPTVASPNIIRIMDDR
jgi:hypothetical protein